MRQITEIGKEPRQELILIGENNERIDFLIEFRPTQQAWYFNLTYLDFTVNGMKLVNSPNILRQFDNAIPFGISCIVADGTDPYFLEDFINGRVVINLLTEAEVATVEENIFG